MKEELKEILERKNGWSEQLAGLIGTYKELYGLPVIKKTEKISDDFYEYCLQGKYFVVATLYNQDKLFVVKRDLSKEATAWGLTGGWVREGENVDKVIDETVLRETGSFLVEALPIAIVENTYVTSKGRKVIHEGIAFMGLVKSGNVKKKDVGLVKDPMPLLGSRDQQIVGLTKIKLENKVSEAPIEEIESYNNLSIKKIIHNLIVKPISYWGSSRVLKKAIRSSIGDVTGKSVLDVACGDDDLVCDLANTAKLVVANDISRESMKKLMVKSKSNLIFSNQNMVELNFDKKFDVVLVKNVMHHLRDASEMDKFLEQLRKLGKRIVIMDVQNPKENFIAWLWNRYYVYFLDDQGGFFINFAQFNKILSLYFGEGVKMTKKVWTVKGPFMLGVINNK